MHHACMCLCVPHKSNQRQRQQQHVQTVATTQTLLDTAAHHSHNTATSFAANTVRRNSLKAAQSQDTPKQKPHQNATQSLGQVTTRIMSPERPRHAPSAVMCSSNCSPIMNCRTQMLQPLFKSPRKQVVCDLASPVSVRNPPTHRAHSCCSVQPHQRAYCSGEISLHPVCLPQCVLEALCIPSGEMIEQ